MLEFLREHASSSPRGRGSATSLRRRLAGAEAGKLPWTGSQSGWHTEPSPTGPCSRRHRPALAGTPDLSGLPARVAVWPRRPPLGCVAPMDDLVDRGQRLDELLVLCKRGS